MAHTFPWKENASWHFPSCTKGFALLNVSQLFSIGIFSQGLPRPLAELAVPVRVTPASVESCRGLGLERHRSQHSKSARPGATRDYSWCATAFSAFKEVLGCLGFPGHDSSGNKREIECQWKTETSPPPDTALSQAAFKTCAGLTGGERSCPSRRWAAACASHCTATGRSGAGASSGAEGRQGGAPPRQRQQVLPGRTEGSRSGWASQTPYSPVPG